jgi:hypothetical protein
VKYCRMIPVARSLIGEEEGRDIERAVNHLNLLAFGSWSNRIPLLAECSPPKGSMVLHCQRLTKAIDRTLNKTWNKAGDAPTRSSESKCLR